MGLIQHYYDGLRRLPAPGHGLGCHTSLLGVANLGIIAGVDPQAIFDDIRDNIPPGTRKISDREIQDAVNKALADHDRGAFTPMPRPKPVVTDGKAALRRIIEQSDIDDEADLWELSPIRLNDEPKDDPALFLENIFNKSDLVWIDEFGEIGKPGENIKPVVEWSADFRNGRETSTHIIVNPLTGKPAPKKSNPAEMTYRGDNCIASYKYCLIEFDNLSHEDQIRFWTAVRLPIIALIDTGGKSIHGWLDVQKITHVSTSEEWKTNIENKLYDRIFLPMGIDGACKNPARLSRLPGHFREEKEKYQRLLWLSPVGRPICQK